MKFDHAHSCVPLSYSIPFNISYKQGNKLEKYYWCNQNRFRFGGCHKFALVWMEISDTQIGFGFVIHTCVTLRSCACHWQQPIKCNCKMKVAIVVWNFICCFWTNFKRINRVFKVKLGSVYASNIIDYRWMRDCVTQVKFQLDFLCLHSVSWKRAAQCLFGLKSHSENGTKVLSVIIWPRYLWVKKCGQYTTDYKRTNVL